MRWGGKETWENIVAYLHEEQPDILMLQEVYNSTEPNVPTYLSAYTSLKEKLGYSYTEYEPQFNMKHGEDYGALGLAIFSKFPLLEKSVLWLQGNGVREVDHDDEEGVPTQPRNLLHCKTEINGETYNLMTLHGVWAPDGNETELQKEMAKRIFGYIADKENIILSGDFNVNENTSCINLLEGKLKNIFKGERTTSFNMTRKQNPVFATAIVDFIFVSPNIKVVDHCTSDKDVSDHQSQIVVIEA